MIGEMFYLFNSDDLDANDLKNSIASYSEKVKRKVWAGQDGDQNVGQFSIRKHFGF